MTDKKSLMQTFDESKVADEIRHLTHDPVVMEGANAFYSHQALLTEEVSQGSKMCEWNVTGRPSVLIMSEKHAKALLAFSDMPLVENRMQYPTKDFERARHGEIALGMTKERSPMVVMMNKEIVMGLIDPMARHESEMRGLVERMQTFMDERGFAPSDMDDVLDRLEQEYPKPSDADDSLNHD